MKIKIILLVISMLFSMHANAAFSYKENNELYIINDQQETNLIGAKEKFLVSVRKVINDSPEKKDAIISLEVKWEAFIKAKCDFEVFESKGRDAEIAEMSDCLVREYNNANKYFDHVLP